MFPLSSILVATDLGPASDVVVRAAVGLAQRTGAGLHLVHALDLESPPYGIAPEGPIGTFRERIERHRSELENQVERLVPAGMEVESTVVDYVAYKAITDLARTMPADLVVFGPNRDSVLRAHLLGTTADRVVRTAVVPSLVVRAPLELPLSRIGVALDFSEPSRHALDVALDWSVYFGPTEAFGAPESLAPLQIDAFHIPWTRDFIVDPERLEEEVLRPGLEREIEEARFRHELPLHARITANVRWELSPTFGITEYAKEHALDLIIMGTHGYGGVRRFLIGSVANGVAREAPCSVLLIPPVHEE